MSNGVIKLFRSPAYRFVISPRSTVELRSRSANESKNGWICSCQYAGLALLNPGML